MSVAEAVHVADASEELPGEGLNLAGREALKVVLLDEFVEGES